MKPQSIVDKAKAENAVAVALTDVNKTCGIIEFQQSARKHSIKPIVGAEVSFETLFSKEMKGFSNRMILLAESPQGHANINQIVSMSSLDRTEGKQIFIEQWFGKVSTDGIVCLSGFENSDLGQLLLRGKNQDAEDLVDFYKSVFPGRFFLEVQRDGSDEFETLTKQMILLSQKTGTPIVATHPNLFEKESDALANELKNCIFNGEYINDINRRKIAKPTHRYKSAAEMIQSFQDLPEAIENTNEIAKLCNFDMALGQNTLPEFVAGGPAKESKLLAQLSNAGLDRRMMTLFPNDEIRNANLARYQARLDEEVGIIEKMGFSGYFLIVQDFIAWSKKNDVPIGPGRGSGAGSLVAYCLEITDIDPIENDLLFERFLNPERVSMPDFDIDICGVKRDSVIEYMRKRYGDEKVAQIGSYSTLASRSALNAVGRALQAPRSIYEGLSALVPMEANTPIDLKQAYETSENFAAAVNESPEAREIYDAAVLVEDQPRGMGTHAAGIVIAPTSVFEYSALFQAEGVGKPVTTLLNKDHIESAGLVKFDLLGLANLTIIDQALQQIEANYGKAERPDLSRIPLNDPCVYDLFRQGKTTAVFQCESSGAKDLEVKMQPSSFDDLTALLALNRPGPLGSGMVNDFIDRKKQVNTTGKHNPEWFYHPSLEDTLKPTYGMIVYQEQVMRIAQIIAGYSLGQADLLRRAMGKKKPEEMAKQRQIFLDGAQKRGIDADLAVELFDLMAKFADYGFNKSHSAAYALISYQTAWLKAQYPAEYMAATLSNKFDSPADIEPLLNEVRTNCFAPGHGEHGYLEVLMPCVNASDATFAAEMNTFGTRAKAIRYGLAALAGIGIEPARAIVQERATNGLYTSFADFVSRNPSIKKPTLEQLIRSGAFDSLNANRAELLLNAEASQKWTKKLAENNHPSLFEEEVKKYVDLDIPGWKIHSAQTEPEECMAMERQAFGFYPNESPFTQMEKRANYLALPKLCDLQPKSSDQSFIAQISAIKMVRTRSKGEDMAILTLSDCTQSIDAVVFPSQYKEYASLIEKGAGLLIDAKIELDSFGGSAKTKALIQKVECLEQKLEFDEKRGMNQAKLNPELHLYLGEDPDLDRFNRGLHRYNDPSDNTRQFLHFVVKGIPMDKELPQQERMRVSPELVESLKKYLGPTKVKLLANAEQNAVGLHQSEVKSWEYELTTPHGIDREVSPAKISFDAKTATYTLSCESTGTKTQSDNLSNLLQAHIFQELAPQSKAAMHAAA